ncbi:uncharacterized protein LOC143273016 isoform X8 [Peromyscus maniculatus bairdii]|uniref:uncharacterized protein LOC143273016 isoform X8 n=1 Tax=Peromyscus maniculatus bairdii TaxID=230844 RepID=UPI003FD33D0F
MSTWALSEECWGPLQCPGCANTGNPTGAEQCPCAAEKTARVSWADPASTTKTPPALRTYCFTSNLHVVSSLWKWLGITQQDGSPYASWLGLPLQGLKPS